MGVNVPAMTDNDPRKLVRAIRELAAGRSNAAGQFNLATSPATTTTVTAPNCGAEFCGPAYATVFRVRRLRKFDRSRLFRGHPLRLSCCAHAALFRGFMIRGRGGGMGGSEFRPPAGFLIHAANDALNMLEKLPAIFFRVEILQINPIRKMNTAAVPAIRSRLHCQDKWGFSLHGLDQ